MYSPTLGRFITADPIGFQAGDVNLYRFVENNPTNATDPSGLAPNGQFGVGSGIKMADAGADAAAKKAIEPMPTVPGELPGKWEVKMTPWNSRNDSDAGLTGTIWFTPDPKKSPQTRSIRLIQAWRRIDSTGQYLIFDKDDERAEANEVTVRSNSVYARILAKDELGWRIDYLPKKIDRKNPVKPYYSEFFLTAVNTGSNVNGKVCAASLEDRPHGFAVGDRFEFETIAVDTDSRKILGAVRWGYTLKSDEKNRLRATPTPVIETRDASAAVKAALALFLAYYKADF